MTRKLLVTVALGAALAIMAAGTAISGTVGGTDQITVPGTGAVPQCSNLIDDDGDGLIDMNDPGCSSPLDNSESDTPTSPGGTGTGSTTTGGSTTTTPSGGSGSSGATSRGGKAHKKAAPKTPGLFGKQAKKGQGAKDVAKAERSKITEPALRNPDGSPTGQNPWLPIAP